MSFREYLHEKAEESRHNETLAYLMFLAGAVFFVGAILATLNLPGKLDWFLILPYCAEPSSGMFLSLTMLVSGVLMIFLGIAAGFHYSNDRGWYMQELRKANTVENGIVHKKSNTGEHKNRNSKA
jgi:uncharacterized membrane protein YiaA